MFLTRSGSFSSTSYSPRLQFLYSEAAHRGCHGILKGQDILKKEKLIQKLSEATKKICFWSRFCMFFVQIFAQWSFFDLRGCPQRLFWYLQRSGHSQEAKIHTKIEQNHVENHVLDRDFAHFLYEFLLLEVDLTSEDVHWGCHAVHRGCHVVHRSFHCVLGSQARLC